MKEKNKGKMLLADEIKVSLKSYIDYYEGARRFIGMPVDRKKISNTIENINIDVVDRENTTGTFSVSKKANTFGIIKNNYKNNGWERNCFLLLHEFTHLDSDLNANLPRKEDMERYDKLLEGKTSAQNISGFDVCKGVVAVEEVIAQWTAEKCNDAVFVNPEKVLQKERFTILGTDFEVKTDFSNHDIYSPLEECVINFSKELGFEQFKDFASAVLSDSSVLLDNINSNNVETLGYLGILCEGIYQTNGFEDFGLPTSDIPIALSFFNIPILNSKIKTNNECEEK